MKISIAFLMLFSVGLSAQTPAFKEKANEAARNSIFEPVDMKAPDGIMSLRASGPYSWSVTPVIGGMWGHPKWLALAIEVVGDNLRPSTAVFVVDGATIVLQSANWQRDTRGNLCAMFDKPGLVRSIAKANDITVSVFAPSPLIATFKMQDLEAFRAAVQAFDTNVLHAAKEEVAPVQQATLNQSKHAEMKETGKMRVKIVDKESGTTAYDWEMNGRVSVSCIGDSCSGYYTLPSAGTQHIKGAVLRLLRPDSSIVVVECVSKVNVMATLGVAIDAINASDPNSPTVYRDCRIPAPNIEADANFHKTTVKLWWAAYGSRESETYEIVGVLHPFPLTAH